jgi:hypothetical protein
MIHVFKIGGDWKNKDGIEYDVKPVNSLSEAKEGYFASLELAIAAMPKPKKKSKAKVVSDEQQNSEEL